ncbi:hypothetical protein EES47_24945 [Streptomyces sp. ADI98-12]|nr:hypothetical protein EES47_24945 [Streptomyces sp. ADI98-12]
MVLPRTTWSASHGCASTDNRPVSTTPPESGSDTTAPTNGWSAVSSPAPAAAGAPSAAVSQYRSRWKA